MAAAAAFPTIRVNAAARRRPIQLGESGSEIFMRLISGSKSQLYQDRIVNEVLGVLMLDGWQPARAITTSYPKML
jgi:hypothetical protein